MILFAPFYSLMFVFDKTYGREQVPRNEVPWRTGFRKCLSNEISYAMVSKRVSPLQFGDVENMKNAIFTIQTFGCQMNANDSDWLARSLMRQGHVPGSFKDANLHIINTCSVRDKPEQKVYSELGRIAHHAKISGREDIIVCVGGCVAQQVGASLGKRFPLVRLVFGTDGVTQAPDAIERLLENPGLRINLLDFETVFTERDDAWEQGIPASAFVNIMQGCNNFCTYCIVPYVRGRQKSRVMAHVVEECRKLVEGGTKEITLLGQNVNSYGHDLGGDAPSFTELLRAIAALDGLERLRFMTPHPKDIAPELIEAFGELPELCPRLHLPVQSGSNAILQAMGRKYTVEKYLGIVEKIKKVRSDILFSTDIIVGFPGEQEEDFQGTLQMVREVGYVQSFSFVYSDRPLAKAVLLPHKVERGVAMERLSRLQTLQQEFEDRVLGEQIGLETVLLVENKSLHQLLPDNGLPIEETSPLTMPEGWQTWLGKTPQGINVNVSLPPLAEYSTARKSLISNAFTGQNSFDKEWVGKLVPVRIEAASKHSLKASVIGNSW